MKNKSKILIFNLLLAILIIVECSSMDERKNETKTPLNAFDPHLIEKAEALCSVGELNSVILSYNSSSDYKLRSLENGQIEKHEKLFEVLCNCGIDTLQINYYPYEQLPASLSYCTELVKVDLRSSEDLKVPVFPSWTELKHLDLEGNTSTDITILASHLAELKSLRHLNLGNCNLDSIPQKIAFHPSIEVLSLIGNSDLDSIPADDRFCPNLRILMIAGTGVDIGEPKFLLDRGVTIFWN